jgi:iron complex outermembrane receptor protein
MSRPALWGVGLLLALALPLIRGARAQEPRVPEKTESITIQAESVPAESRAIAIDDLALSASDATQLVRRLPGANLNANGPLSGQVQYRGLSSTRMRVTLDEMPIAPGGPNWMDPPLHYMPAPLLERIELQRGIASVSAGPGTLGGHVAAHAHQSRFAESDALELHGNLSLGTRSADESLTAGGMLALSSSRLRLHVLASQERGDDRAFADGDVKGTSFERASAGVGGGVRIGAHELALDWRHQRTGETGTPALPQDIRFFDTELFRFSHSTQIGRTQLSTRAFWSDIDHRMDNANLRPAPTSPAGARSVDAEARTAGIEARAQHPLGAGSLELGFELHRARHEMLVRNPNVPAFFVDGFDDVERELAGFWAEWRARLAPRLSAELGLRYDRVRMRAGAVELASTLPLPAQALARGFNATDRRQRDAAVDWVAKLRLDVSNSLALHLGVARKTRVPHYIERYAWLPVEATAGLADGNNYVGDPDLDPEFSHEVDLGVEWSEGGHFVRPRIFWRRVEDYIQGVPVDATPGVIDSPLEMVSAANGDPTPLRYANVDAVLYGADMDWGLALAPHWSLEGNLSFVRGRRTDQTDDLYRIPPLWGAVALTYERVRWSATLENVFASSQRRVARTNQELRTSGYGLLNLRGRVRPREGLSLTLELYNVLDQAYREHLGGFNRVEQRDIAAGERLPGTGRSLRLYARWAF